MTVAGRAGRRCRAAAPAAAAARLAAAIAVAPVLGLACAVVAAQPAAAPAKAAPCAACHGPLGLSTLPTAPNLAGQPEGYLVEQLKAYRGGKRVHEMMSLIARPLSDDDIAQLASWYASIGVEVRRNP